MSTVKLNPNLAQGQTRINEGIDGWFNRLALQFEQARFGWMTICIIAQSCLGSIACMYILENKASDVMLASCAALTMGCNAMFIAQAPGKWCLSSFFLSILANSVFIFINL